MRCVAVSQVQRHFIDLFSAEVLQEWYARAGTWCQGSANLTMSLLIGVDSWQHCRDFMNMRSREYRQSPSRFSHDSAANTHELGELLARPPHLPFVMYVELDCWRGLQTQQEEEEEEEVLGGGGECVGEEEVVGVGGEEAVPPPASATEEEEEGGEGEGGEGEGGDSEGGDPAEEMEHVDVPLHVFYSSGNEALPPAISPPPGEADADADADADAEPVRRPVRRVKARFDVGGGRRSPFVATGGHVFMIQVDKPPADLASCFGGGGGGGDDDDDEGEEGGGGGGRRLPLSAYTIYSSWSGRYTLQDWLESRPELAQMDCDEFGLWVGALKVTPTQP